MYNKNIVAMALDHGIGAAALEAVQTLLNEGGEIIALHVYEAPSGSVGAFLDTDVVKAAFESSKTKMDARVKDLANVWAAVFKGHSGRTISDVAADRSVDCIVIGSHKPGLIDYLLGSTAARVVRHAPCAVHVLRSVS